MLRLKGCYIINTNFYSPIPTIWLETLLEKDSFNAKDQFKELFIKNVPFDIYSLNAIEDNVKCWNLKEFDKAKKNLFGHNVIYLNELAKIIENPNVVDSVTLKNALKNFEISNWRSKFSESETTENIMEYYLDNITSYIFVHESISQTIEEIKNIDIEYIAEKLNMYNDSLVNKHVKELKSIIEKTSKPIILSVWNSKGGVGKTTTMVSLSDQFARYGFRTLCIDADYSRNFTDSRLSVSPLNGKDKIKKHNSFEGILDGSLNINETIVSSNIDNLYVVPSSLNASKSALDIAEKELKIDELRNYFYQINEQFDIILIDCPPYQEEIIQGVWRASDYLILPLQAEYYASKSVNSSLNKIKHVQLSNQDSELKVLGYVTTMSENNPENKKIILDYFYKYKQKLDMNWLGNISYKQEVLSQSNSDDPLYKYAKNSISDREIHTFFTNVVSEIVEDKKFFD